MSTPTTGLSQFAQVKRVRLTTYAANGNPVGTTTSIAVEGDHAFVRTHRRAGDHARLERYPEVEISKVTMGGTPDGAPMKARARRLRGAEARHAARRLALRHPVAQAVATPIGYALIADRPVHYELRLVGE
ncbi:hypothetical protein [Streptomyces sp. NPDC005438]|uniref:hypothetical protein n=1 Tax=Streptomyces sp. NPDC005438 TaxID=3156880 RepID=UPI0033B950B6